MADFTESLKKIVPTSGETKILTGWGLSSVVLFALSYVVFSFITSSGVSSKRLPIVRVLVLSGVLYAVLMVRDIIAYYAGVGVDEMYSFSPVVVFGVLFFMSVFLIYSIHDIQDIGSLVAESSQKTGGNLFSLFFETDENFEEIDETPATHNPRVNPSQQMSPPAMTSGDSMGVSQYGPSNDPFTNAVAGGSHSLPQSTRDKDANSKMYDQRGDVNVTVPPPSQPQQVHSAPLMPSNSGMGGNFSAF
jgi:hypothetical protein